MADLKGTNVPSKIVPYTTSDNYATHDEEYGVGGYRTVNSVSEMNAIPDARRKEGMLVNVKGDKIYKLNSSNTFVDAGLSGGGSSVYYVNFNNLDFRAISDGDDASDDQINEATTCIINWIQEKTIIYNNYNNILIDGDYIGVLNMGFNASENTVSFILPYNQQGSGAYLYNIDMTNKVWTVKNLGEGGGVIDWNSGSNLSQNGYQKFSNGLMIQWGYAQGAGPGSGKTVYMPTSFINSTYNVQSAGILSNTSEKIVYSPSVYIKNTSNFTIYTRYIGQGSTNVETTGWFFEWIAVGRWK